MLVRHSAAVVAEASVEQCFSFFAQITAFPKYMRRVTSVVRADETVSRWTIRLFGVHRWEARDEDWIENRQIGWRGVAGARHWGRVLFRAEGPARTRLSVELSYDPPAGRLGRWLDEVWAGEIVERSLREELDRFACIVARVACGMRASVAASIPLAPRMGAKSLTAQVK